MRTIVDNDLRNTPVENRTVKYFVKEYLEKHAHKRFHNHRYIFDDEDSDVDLDGNTKLFRHPRPMHRYEILSLFAEHCEWILNDKWARKLVNVEKWKKFCKRVRVEKSMSRQTGGRWGVTPGMDHDADSDADIEEGSNSRRSRSLVDVPKKLPKKKKKKVRLATSSLWSSSNTKSRCKGPYTRKDHLNA
jgi:hypothetical protein